MIGKELVLSLSISFVINLRFYCATFARNERVNFTSTHIFAFIIMPISILRIF